MDSKKNQVRSASSSSSSSSSSSTSFDHLFGPRGSPSGSSSYSSSSELLNSIFPPPSTAQGRKQEYQVSSGKFQDDIGGNNKGERRNRTDRSSMYQKAETAEPCYFSSSIYYGGQENYSPRSKSNDHPHVFKKDGGDDDSEDPNGNNGASRGNWWQGSLYY